MAKTAVEKKQAARTRSQKTQRALGAHHTCKAGPNQNMQRRKSQTLMPQMKLAGVPIAIMSLIAQVMACRHFDISES
eukprot:9079167-Pyramimonas_sp.AAC.1